MLTTERMERLADMLQRGRTLSVTGAAEVLGVSTSTIRRDLAELERQGVAARVRGGAVSTGTARQDTAEPPRLTRRTENPGEKRRIGRAAARMIREGESILITGGTTTDAMLPFLGNIGRLTILTNNIETALGAARHPNIEVVVLGGYLRRDELSLLGHLAVDALQQLTIDRAFFSAYAVGPDGLMGAEVRETETDRGLVAAARELIVLADHSKFGRSGPTRLAPASTITTLITDTWAPRDVLDALAEQGVTIVVC